MSQTESIIARAKTALVSNYKQQPVVLERGLGVYVWDVDGRKYLDLICGSATCALGHCHPQVVDAAKSQLDKLWHVSNVFYSEPQIALAERLTRASEMKNARAFFCNSGAEANEALIKLARRFHYEKGDRSRHEIITFEGGFHGRTLATVTATAQPKYHVGFEPLPAGFIYSPVDLDAVTRKISSKTAAILVEPIQGEGGVRPLPPGFLLALRKRCDENGILLLIDEVQTGIGRTGRPFAYQHEGVIPDAFSLAKALGNGLPIGAMICSGDLAMALPSGSHGSTFGGNLVAATAARVVWDLATSSQMLETISTNGVWLQDELQALQRRNGEKIVDVRGRGLLAGIEVSGDAAAIVGRCRERGLLLNLAGEKTLRLAPAYVTTREQLREGLGIIESAL